MPRRYRYDPLRALLSAKAPSASAGDKYDAVRGVLDTLRADADAAAQQAQQAGGDAQQAQQAQRKYDMVYDMLSALKSSGELSMRGRRGEGEKQRGNRGARGQG